MAKINRVRLDSIDRFVVVWLKKGILYYIRRRIVLLLFGWDSGHSPRTSFDCSVGNLLCW